MNILITGAGGPAAISFLKACRGSQHVFWMGDMDPYATGLYLVEQDKRVVLPRGNTEAFVPAILRFCIKNAIDILVPTVDAELLPLARAANDFAGQGIHLLLSSEIALSRTLDKYQLFRHCQNTMPLAAYALLDEQFDPHAWEYPLLLKPRTGAGSRGICKIDTPDQLSAFDKGGSHIIQEYLPGEEYSVDCYVSASGKCLVAVPRARLRTDSGVAVVSVTRHDAELTHLSKLALAATGNQYLANVQFRRDRQGIPRLLEINPRASGTLPLTVRAGTNTPMMALEDLSGTLVQEERDFQEIAVVRYLEETFVSPDVFGTVPEA